MKITVTYVVLDDDDRVESLESEHDFEFSIHDPPYEIQDVIEGYEDEGFTIDQGGDDEEYELNLADGTTQATEHLTHATAESLLRDVQEALSSYVKLSCGDGGSCCGKCHDDTN